MTKAEATKLAKAWNEKHGPGTRFKADSWGDELFMQSDEAIVFDNTCYVPYVDDDGETDYWNVIICKAISTSTPEPAPKPNDLPAVWELVIRDMKDRDDFGRQKYGTPLQPHNGRKSLVDAYQEALDLAVYLRQEIFEREGK